MRIVCVIGTRPELIKMAPVVKELRSRPWTDVSLLSTAQHRELVDELLGFFELSVNDDLDVMTANQSLAELTSRILTRTSAFLNLTRPDWVIAQGDTTTVMGTAVACFYGGIPFAHVEAGLRTGDLQQPFPEEFNRIVAGRVASLNFAPTETARHNLLREGVKPESIFVTGNTVIDALLWTAARVGSPSLKLGAEHKIILMTFHRRESFGAPMLGVFAAIREIVERNRDVAVIYPVHPNPNVSGPAEEYLGGLPRVHLLPPLRYPDLVAWLKRSHLVLTDSGGIQEEAPALGKPVLVLRQATERQEAVDAGLARLVGTDTTRVVTEVEELLRCPESYARMARGGSPYGDGRASGRIADVLEDVWRKRKGTDANRIGGSRSNAPPPKVSVPSKTWRS